MMGEYITLCTTQNRPRLLENSYPNRYVPGIHC